MATLRKKFDCNNWIACFGGTNRSTGTPNRQAAQLIADAYEKSAKAAKAGRFNETQARKVLNDILERAGEKTMNGDTVESYFKQWLGKHSNKATSERYTRIADMFIKSLGKNSDAYLSSITHKDISGFIESRRESGMAPSTVKVDLKILNNAFNLARKMEIIDANPVEKAMTLQPKFKASLERKPFTIEQVSKLVQTATGEWLTLILLGYYTGARLVDCATMKWDNVDFDRHILTYTAQKTKTVSSVPLSAQLESHLLKLASTDSHNPFLSPSLSNRKSCGVGGLSGVFGALMAKAGIDPEIIKGNGIKNFSQLSFHSLRHTFNSLLANNGVDQETRKKLIGHKTDAVNTGYTHLDIEKLKGAMDKLPQLKMGA